MASEALLEVRLKAEEHGKLRAVFERVLDNELNYADTWACLSNQYCVNMYAF